MKNRLTLIIFTIILFSHSLLAQEKPTPSLVLAVQKSSLILFKDPKTNLYGFKDASDKIVIACKYTFATAFSDGMAAVNMGGKVGFDKEYTNDYFVNGGKWGYINEAGKLVIPCKYDGADFFYDGYAIVEMKGKKTFVDKTGKELTAFIYDMINPFSEGLAAVGKGDPLLFGYIDKTGKQVITGDYSAAANFFKGKARVTRYGALFFINPKGERIK